MNIDKAQEQRLPNAYTPIAPKPHDNTEYKADVGLDIGEAAKYRRPKHPKVYCQDSDTHPEGFNSEHELNRHKKNKHGEIIKKFVVRDPAEAGLQTYVKVVWPLDECKACVSKKQYGDYNNAAAHLRNYHFNSFSPPKRRINTPYKNRAMKVGWSWPPMSELKNWFVEVLVPGPATINTDSPMDCSSSIFSEEYEAGPADDFAMEKRARDKRGRVSESEFLLQSLGHDDFVHEPSTISATSMQLQQADIVNKFSGILLHHIGMFPCIGSTANESNMEALRSGLEANLHLFSVASEHDAPDISTRMGCNSIRVWKSEIVRQCDKALRNQSADFDTHRPFSSIEKKAQDMFSTIASADKASGWLNTDFERIGLGSLYEGGIENDSHPAPSESASASVPSVTAMCITKIDLYACDILGMAATESSDIINSVDITEYWTTHPVFAILVHKARRLVERYCGNSMEIISHEVSCHLGRIRQTAPHWSHRALLRVGWDVMGFLQGNYPAGLKQDLSLVLCFVGHLADAQLTTVGDYCQKIWPKWSSTLLSAISQSISGLVVSKNRGRRDSALPEGAFIDVQENGTLFLVGGSAEFIIAMAQQLGWLAAACRTGDTGMTYSRVDFAFKGEEEEMPNIRQPTFHINIKMQAPSTMENKSCWNILMGKSVLVAGYPIPDRPENVSGLESQLGILSNLIGIRQAVTYRGGYVLKGRFHALVPVETSQDTTQWHLVSTSPRKLKWTDIDGHCPKRAMGTEMKHLNTIQSSRAFLGWCGEVENLMGTREFQYDKVGFTKCELASETYVGISEISFGVAHFVQATTRFTLSKKKEGVFERERSDYYEDMLDDARDISVFLYDTKDKRASHIDGERLILQAILHAHHKKPYVVDGNTVNLSALLVTEDPREVMMRNAHVLLRKGIPLRQDDTAGILSFKDRAVEIFETLCSLQAYGADAPPLSFSVNSSACIYGWEYMDIVTRTRKMRAKQTRLQKTCGSWPLFAVDSDVNGVFLIGHNFGDILRPAGSVCLSYQNIPQGMDYLGISVATLSDLYERHGSQGDHKQLTSSGFSWHRPCMLFEPCSRRVTRNGSQCQCDRIQEFLAPRTSMNRLRQPKLIEPGPLDANGAAIFGQSPGKATKLRWNSSSIRPKPRASIVGLIPADDGITPPCIQAPRILISPGSDVVSVSTMPTSVSSSEAIGTDLSSLAVSLPESSHVAKSHEKHSKEGGKHGEFSDPYVYKASPVRPQCEFKELVHNISSEESSSTLTNPGDGVTIHGIVDGSRLYREVSKTSRQLRRKRGRTFGNIKAT